MLELVHPAMATETQCFILRWIFPLVSLWQSETIKQSHAPSTLTLHGSLALANTCLQVAGANF